MQHRRHPRPKLQLLALPSFGGLHADIPLRDGDASLDLLPPVGDSPFGVMQGAVIAAGTHPRVIAGLRTWHAAQAAARRTSPRRILLPTFVIDDADVRGALEDWAKWEIALGHYDQPQRLRLLVSLMQRDFNAYKGHRYQTLQSVFDLPHRSIGRAKAMARAALRSDLSGRTRGDE